MTYAALARRYRPRRFQDVVGQDHAVKALAHALDTGRLHPALLLTGTRGVGKTTLARLLAKGLNCETGVTSNPCNVCGACTEIDAGRFVDLLEIDAASHTGVDNIRELIENAQYLPARGRFKVYLIDEVHMLSRSAFNALLKTLEEPPAHVKFILATTDPQKLPVTVLSRCLRFPLKRLSAGLIGQQLAHVLGAEGVAADPEALRLIAQAADGSVRDALSLTDQAIAYGGGEVALASVEDMLGLTGRQALAGALLAVAAGDGAALVGAFRQLEDQGADHTALLDEVAGALQRAALAQALPAAGGEDAAPGDEPGGLPARLAAAFTPEELQLHYQIAILARRDLPHTPEPRMAFEMALLRMHAFRLEAGAGDPAAGAERRPGAGDGARPDGGGRGPAPRSGPPGPPGPGGAGAAGAAPRQEGLSPLAAARARAVGGPAPTEPVPPSRPPAPASPPAEPPPWNRVDAPPPVAAVAPAPGPPPTVASPVVAPAPTAPMPARPTAPPERAAERAPAPAPTAPASPPWHDLIETLGLEGLTRQMARHCAWEGFSADGTELALVLDQTQGRLLRPERRQALQEALSSHFGRPQLRLEIGLGEVETASAAHTMRAVETRRREALAEAIASDPVVEAFDRLFGAKVRPGSTGPAR